MLLGGTVGKNKNEMSLKEYTEWCEYFRRVGRCGPVRIYDMPAARIQWTIDHALGAETSIKDYLPQWSVTSEEDDDEGLASVQDIFREFGGVKKRG
jgi:hypothetical protein